MVKEMQLADKQMDIFTRDDLEKLLAQRRGPCVSIYFPTERRGIITKGNPIRLKNLLDEVKSQLAHHKLRSGEIDELLEPIRARLDDSWFWQHQNAGLALFAAPGESYSFRLPIAFESIAEAADAFITRPLVPLLTGDGFFYILALSRHGVRLLQCSRFSYSRLELAGVPTSLPEELRYDVFQENVEHHGFAPEGGNKIGMWHGHGGNADNAILKQRVMDFCHHLEDGVRERLAGERAPLILAGVEYLPGFYREVNRYPNLLDSVISTNTDQAGDEILQRRGWEIAEPLFARQRETALATYQRRAGSHEPRAAGALDAVIPAAFRKRVETLFIPERTQCWGFYDRGVEKVTQHESRQNGDVDLLDLAASETLKNHGTVYMIPPDSIPNSTEVAALFRY